MASDRLKEVAVRVSFFLPLFSPYGFLSVFFFFYYDRSIAQSVSVDSSPQAVFVVGEVALGCVLPVLLFRLLIMFQPML
jgi:hypothetical protein